VVFAAHVSSGPGGIPSTDVLSISVLGSVAASLRASDFVYRTEGLEIAWVSPSVGALLGFDPADLVGTPAADLLSDEQDRSWLDRNRLRLLAGEEVVQRLLVRRATGAPVWASAVARPVREGDQVVGFVALVRVEDVALDQGIPPIAGADPAFVPVAGVEGRLDILGHLDEILDRQSSGVCVLMVEFTNLRLVNESLGHAAGDVALAELARRLRASMGTGERIGRVSGKAFLVGCQHGMAPEAARERASDLIREWSAPVTVGGLHIEPVLSGAIVQTTADSTSLSILREADIALSHARSAGESAVIVFDREMSDRVIRRFVLEDELRFALDADEFELHFQPIVHLSDGSPVATEALVRWRHPREGLLTPPAFMPVAEESRLIRPIGRTVLARAMEALQALPPHALQVGINVSAVELSDPAWLDGVTYTIERSGTDPCCLVVEITETAMLGARRDVAADLRALRDMGVGVFLDDFGTGYSSLAMLRDYPVSGIKLDKSFVASLDDPDSFGAALAQGILDLIRPLGLAGVAEGIETREQADRLAELGWEFGQGYLFGRPGPFSALPPVPSRLLGARSH